MSFLLLRLPIYLLNINDMYILFATNTVKNCLYFASRVKNEKSNTVNRCRILLRVIMSSFIPIGQLSTDGALGSFQKASPHNNNNDDDDGRRTTTTTRLAAIGDQFLVQESCYNTQFDRSK
jgi:hypothetical protein